MHRMRRFIWFLAAAAVGALLAAVVLAVEARTRGGGSLLYLLMVPLPFLTAGVFLLWRKPEHRAGWLLVAGTTFSMVFSALLEQLVKRRFGEFGAEPWMGWALTIEGLVSMVGLACLALLIGLFPTGTAKTDGERRFARAVWWLPMPLLAASLANRTVLTDGITYRAQQFESPIFVEGFAWLGPPTSAIRYFLAGVLFVAVGLLIVRYRRESPQERRQIRWVLYGSAIALAIGVVPFIAQPITGAGSDVNVKAALLLGALALLLIPATVVAAIEEPAWLDTDSVIRKSFAYGALSVGIFVVYAGVASGLGLAAGARMPIEVAIVVTAVLAFAFQPVRRRLQRIADRWVFGDRPTPLEAVAAFDLPADRSVTDLAPRLAELVRTTLRLKWVEVDLGSATADLAGVPGGDAEHVVTIDRADGPQGKIRCGPKLAGQWTDRDRDLVGALAAQAGLLAANAKLTSRIVHAQEAERRRIERNIHDGVQQELVALVAKLGLARAKVRRGVLGETDLVDLQSDAGVILRDLRDFAQGIHPSVLTDGGLVEAVEDRCGRLPIEVRTEFSPGLRQRRFGDDIEGAAYFFVAEGLANVLKHAEATRVHVGVVQIDGALELTVDDDGVGFDAEGTHRAGLAGLSDRFAALAGTVKVDATSGQGTVLRARLPVDGSVL